MPIITTRYGQKLDSIAIEYMGSDSSENLSTITLTNKDVWQGSLIFYDEIELNIPDVAIDYPYNTADLPEEQTTLLTSLQRETPVPAFTGTNSISAVDGAEASRVDAIRDAVVSRVLTVRGERWGNADYGSRFVDILTLLNGPEALAFATREIGSAIAPDEDWYTLDSVALELRPNEIGDIRVIATVSVVDAVTGTPVSTRIIL